MYYCGTIHNFQHHFGSNGIEELFVFCLLLLMGTTKTKDFQREVSLTKNMFFHLKDTYQNKHRLNTNIGTRTIIKNLLCSIWMVLDSRPCFCIHDNDIAHRP